MKDLFAGHYRPSKEEFAQLWKTCLFSFDASFLINLYHYSEQTRDAFFTILESLRKEGRIWLTHQAALEYHNGRIGAIYRELAPYDDVKSRLAEIDRALQAPFEHPFITSQNSIDDFHALATSLSNQLDQGKQTHEAFLTTFDPLLNQLSQLFHGVTGSPYPADKVKEIEKEGKARYESLIPPGFSDASKEHNRYGDLIVWKQLLEKAKDHKSGIVFVTDDEKDWWQKYGRKGHERLLGPHPLLRQEMKAHAGCEFYTYTGQGFVKFAEEYLNQQVEDNVKTELKEAAKGRVRSLFVRDTIGTSTSTPTTTTQQPPSGYVSVGVMRHSEFAQVANMVEDFCEDIVLSQSDETLAMRLRVLSNRFQLLKARWYGDLPENLQGLLDSLLKIADNIPALPPHLRPDMINLLLNNTQHLVKAVAGL